MVSTGTSSNCNEDNNNRGSKGGSRGEDIDVDVGEGILVAHSYSSRNALDFSCNPAAVVSESAQSQVG